ncbi:MAG: ATP-binding protein, partial [Bifidobacteriaceae bacterium]|nr:ATP-binding protein [Bifidobacteriaceae bacterium]
MDPAWRRTIKALADACAALLSPSSIFLKVADIAEHHGYPFADALIAHLNSSLAHSPLESLRANTPADEDQLRLELIANTVHFLHAHTADIREWRGKHPDASDSLSTYLQSLLAPVLAQSDEPQRRFLNQVIHAISDFIIAQPVTQDDRDHWVRQASIKASETRNHITTISETLAHAAVPDDFAVKAKAARESVQSARSLASRALSKIQDLSRAAHDQTNIVLSFGEAEQSVRRLSQGLYVKRELESELLPLLCADGFGATVITGDAGTGKSSLLWRLYCLLTEHSATPVFLKAQWLIARPGDVTLSLDDLERAIDWLLGRRQHPSILVDTADLLAYDDAGRAALARLGRVCEERAVHLCLTSRVKEAAFLPSTWVRKPLGHYRFSPDETNSEFERAVMTHATAFTPDLTIPSELVNDLLDAVARGKPVASIATHPLTLRLMFEIYSPRSIPPNVDVTGLYIELWRRRVPRDIRSDNSIHVSSEDITSTVHWLANQMLQRGLPEMRVSGIAPASQPSSSFPHDLELARRRG